MRSRAALRLSPAAQSCSRGGQRLLMSRIALLPSSTVLLMSSSPLVASSSAALARSSEVVRSSKKLLASSSALQASSSELVARSVVVRGRGIAGRTGATGNAGAVAAPGRRRSRAPAAVSEVTRHRPGGGDCGGRGGFGQSLTVVARSGWRTFARGGRLPACAPHAPVRPADASGGGFQCRVVLHRTEAGLLLSR